MNDSIKQELKTLLGPDRASDAPEELIAHSYDSYTEERSPDIVLHPTSTGEVSAIMKIAYRENIPVTPRGAGTNLAGESVPLRGGITLCLTKMCEIIRIDPANLTAVVQPGVINMELQNSVARDGMMYPPDPASWTVATMGGNVATNAGGPRTLKYGVTKDYLLGLTVVLANGDILKTGGRTIKNVTGYNLTTLMCGSEGTLGVITEITVRLVPKPAATRTIRADFAKLENCSDAVSAIIAAGITPAAMELMDGFVVRAVESAFQLGLPTDAEGMLLIQVDGNPATIDSEVEQIQKILEEKSARNIVTASDPAEIQRLWVARRSAGPALKHVKPNAVTEDVTVPVANLTAMIRKIMEICDKHGVLVGAFAHAGDGNLHPCLLFDRNKAEELAAVQAAFDDIVPEALALGGTLSGEHGIGIAKAPWLKLEMDETAMRVMKGIKDYFDPKGILNPGKFV